MKEGRKEGKKEGREGGREGGKMSRYETARRGFGRRFLFTKQSINQPINQSINFSEWVHNSI